MSQRSCKLWAKHLAGQSTASKSVDPRLLLKKTPYEGRILALIRVCEEPDWPCLRRRFELQAASFRNDQAQAQGFAHRMSRLDSPSRSESYRSLEASPPFLRGNYLRSKLRNCSNHGAARGAALSAAAIRDIPVFEYAPLRVKQAVVGFGRASKEQMAQTLAQMLGLPEALPFDEADGLGLALCHALTWQPS